MYKSFIARFGNKTGKLLLHEGLDYMGMKQKLAATALVSILALAGDSGLWPQQPPKQQVQQVKKRPHYLQQYPTREELESLDAVTRHFLEYKGYITFQKYQQLPRGLPLNKVPRRTLTVLDKEVEVLFPLYYNKDGTLLSLTDNQPVDLAPVVEDLQSTLEEAVELAWKYHKGITAKANERMQQLFGKDIMDKKDKIILGSTLTYQDWFRMLDMHKSDFVPKQLIFGPTPQGAWAATYTNKSLVLYGVGSRVNDYVWGKPFILAHELSHTHSLLQNFPEVWFHDAEEFPNNVSLHNRLSYIEFFEHPYAEVIRNASKVYFNLDAEKMLHGFKQRLGHYALYDEAKLKEALEKADGVLKPIQALLSDKVYPEYLASQPYWAALANHFKDGNILFKIMLAKHYTPTIMSKQAQEQFLQARGLEVDQLIKDAVDTTPFFNNQEGALRVDCRQAGFSPAETEIVVHEFYKRTFLQEDKTDPTGLNVDYSVLSLEKMASSLDKIISGFKSYRKKYAVFYSSDQLKIMDSRLGLYRNLADRVDEASYLIALADQAGTSMPSTFSIDIFDADVNLEKKYSLLPNKLTLNELQKRTPYRTVRAEPKLEQRPLHLQHAKIEYELKNYLVNMHIVTSYTRVIDGKAESRPFAIMFSSKPARTPDMLLLDKDYEGQKGFGKFDEVRKRENNLLKVPGM